MTEVTKRETEVRRIEDIPNGAELTVAQLIRVALLDPSVTPEKMSGLLAVQMKADEWNAQKQFTAAFSRLKFPPITKTKKGHSAKYAAFEDIQRIIDPILEAEGFTLTYSSGEPDSRGWIPTHGTLAHVAGHSQMGSIYLPPDGVATKSGGMNMNALQAIGSATSYGQRYVAKMMLNLRFIGEDDDAASVGQITQQQRESLERYLAACEVKDEMLLKTYGLKALSDLPKTMLEPAFGLVTAKYRANLKAQGCDTQDIDEKIKKVWSVR